jgi:hypothetical protein
MFMNLFMNLSVDLYIRVQMPSPLLSKINLIQLVVLVCNITAQGLV